MSLENKLQERSGSKCELCSATEGLQTYEVSPKEGEDATVYICATC
ncbi:MAG TPA: PhnA domain protein, partial [Phaeodactylibacter sp.]|nr:PhnA domain protein [Phaeodactylibacter sp.]